MNKQKATLVGIVVIVVTLGIVSVLFKTKPAPPKKPQESKAPLVEVLVPQSETVQFEVTSHGVVQPRTETTLVSEVAGIVQQVSEQFVAGGYFKQGELLLTIDPTDYQVAVEQAKARLSSAKAQYAQEKARAEQAQKEWDLSGRSRQKAPSLALRKPFLLEAEANVESAKADLKRAQQKLKRTVIRAPYDGMVKSKNTDVGQFVATGNQLGVTFAIDYAEIRLPLTDQDLAFINIPTVTQQMTSTTPVTLEAKYAGKIHQWQAELVRMEGVVDQNSRVHYAVARVEDPYSLLKQHDSDKPDSDKQDSTEQTSKNNLAPLKMGTFVTAKISGVEMSGLVKLPRENFRNLSEVLVSNFENELYLRDLNVVRAEADTVYVNGGLEPGDKIVVTAIESPVQGMKVRLEGEEEESETSEEAIAAGDSESKPRH